MTGAKMFTPEVLSQESDHSIKSKSAPIDLSYDKL